MPMLHKRSEYGKIIYETETESFSNHQMQGQMSHWASGSSCTEDSPTRPSKDTLANGITRLKFPTLFAPCLRTRS